MKAIETQYKGYRFRSRLEARWAVFMDALGLRWEYEVEGYDLGEQGYYLPDFWLPELELLLEIKPRLRENEWPNIAAFEGDYKLPASLVVLCGSPFLGRVGLCFKRVVSRQGIEATCFYDTWWPPRLDYEGFICGDNNYYWCECPTCHKIGIQYDGRAERINCECFDSIQDKFYNTLSPRLQLAYIAAQQARFEHGESGAPRWARHLGRFT